MYNKRHFFWHLFLHVYSNSLRVRTVESFLPLTQRGSNHDVPSRDWGGVVGPSFLGRPCCLLSLSLSRGCLRILTVGAHPFWSRCLGVQSVAGRSLGALIPPRVLSQLCCLELDHLMGSHKDSLLCLSSFSFPPSSSSPCFLPPLILSLSLLFPPSL